MRLDINGDALKLFEDFLKYGRTNIDEMADAMWYDSDAFTNRLGSLQRAYDKASIKESDQRRL